MPRRSNLSKSSTPRIWRSRRKRWGKQKQIQTLERSAQVLQDRLKTQVATPGAGGGQNAQGQDRQKQITDLQQKEIGLLEQQSTLVAEQLEQQVPAIEASNPRVPHWNRRGKQAALRDLELATHDDDIIEQLDADRRNGPQLPATLKGMFAPTPTNVSPVTIVSTLATRYDLFTHRRCRAVFVRGVHAVLLWQLNKRMLLSGEVSFSPSGVSAWPGTTRHLH